MLMKTEIERLTALLVTLRVLEAEIAKQNEELLRENSANVAYRSVVIEQKNSHLA